MHAGRTMYIWHMQDSKDRDAFYQRLHEELSNSQLWPAVYLYKFIVPTEGDGIVRLNNVFNGMGAIIQTKESSNKKYTSFSIKATMTDPTAVIDKYKEVSDIPNIVSL